MGRFLSKQDAFSRAKKAHMCTACLHHQQVIFKDCPKCGERMRVFFPSRSELNHAALLVQRFSRGEITDLKFHPRFDLSVNGKLITTYVADASYCEGGSFKVIDIKPPGKFIDDLSKLKISLFDALHLQFGVSVQIVRVK